jgi:hypothetical protein
MPWQAQHGMFHFGWRTEKGLVRLVFFAVDAAPDLLLNRPAQFLYT